MKKLVVMLFAVAAAVATQAATVSWTAERGAAKDYASKTIYLIDGADYANAILALTAGGSSVETTFQSYVKGSATVTAGGAFAAVATKLSGTNAETKGGFIVFDGAIADGNTYQATGNLDLSAYAYSGTEQVPATFKITNSTFTLKGQQIGKTEPTPEPTSGLLLLLGVAGLALKRKHA